MKKKKQNTIYESSTDPETNDPYKQNGKITKYYFSILLLYYESYLLSQITNILTEKNIHQLTSHVLIFF